MMEFLIKMILLTHLNSVIFHFLSVYGAVSCDSDTINEIQIGNSFILFFHCISDNVKQRDISENEKTRPETMTKGMEKNCTKPL